MKAQSMWIVLLSLLSLANCQWTTAITAIFGSTCALVTIIVLILAVACCCTYTVMDYFLNLL